MPYCWKCGSFLNDGYRFCPDCRTPVDDQPQVPDISPVPSIVQPQAPVVYPGNSVVQQGNIRKENIAEMDRMIVYFGQKQQQYDEYDVCLQNIEYLSNPRTRVKVKVAGGGGGTQRTFGIVLMAASLPISITIGIYIGANILSAIGYGENSYKFLLVLIFILWTIVFAGGIVLLTFGSKKRENAENIHQREKASQLEAAQNRLAELTNELAAHYEAYGYCALREDYTNPQILVTIRENLLSGRADTIKEALNIVFQDAHYSEMELQASLAAQSAASAARGAKAAAFLSAANFLRNLRR